MDLVLTTLTVTGGTVAPGSHLTCTASGLDQFGNPIATGVITWSLAGTPTTGATINSSTGVFTAGTGLGADTATATVGSVSGTGGVVVAANILPTTNYKHLAGTAQNARHRGPCPN